MRDMGTDLGMDGDVAGRREMKLYINLRDALLTFAKA